MPVLMIDVAKRAGVSITTVSHVINETREIAPETKRRVLKAIKQLNYYKNSSARLLVRGRSDIVGLIISDIENPFLPMMVKSFERAASGAGLELLLGMTNYDARKAERAVRRMIESRAQGVAVMTSQIEGRLIDALVEAEIPVVALDLPKVGKGKSSLGLDYSTGVQEAVDHLYVHGHRDVAIISGPLSLVSVRHYDEAMVAALHEYGMRIVGRVEGNHKPEGGAQALEALFQSKPRPTAVLCGNDLMAIGALGAASRLGIDVPRELSIIGSDDIAMASYSHPALSTVRIPRDAMGHEAFRLLELLYGPPLKRGKETSVATSFVARGSSGPCLKVSSSTPRSGPGETARPKLVPKSLRAGGQR